MRKRLLKQAVLFSLDGFANGHQVYIRLLACQHCQQPCSPPVIHNLRSTAFTSCCFVDGQCL